MCAIAGDLPCFEEAARALFARDPQRFAKYTVGWPKDARPFLERLAEEAMRVEIQEKPVRAASGAR
jgi:hypothetical protein